MTSHTIPDHRKSDPALAARDIDLQRREPRCRICRDEYVRIWVNQLLDWRGVPIRVSRGRTHRVTYVDILRDLEPLNEGRDEKDRITYSSLWVHAKRHYDIEGLAAYWARRMPRKLRAAMRQNRV